MGMWGTGFELSQRLRTSLSPLTRHPRHRWLGGDGDTTRRRKYCPRAPTNGQNEGRCTRDEAWKERDGRDAGGRGRARWLEIIVRLEADVPPRCGAARAAG